MQSIQQVLDTYLRKSGLAKGIAQQRALNLWAEVVGPSIARNTTPEKVEHGVLYIKTKSSPWRQELQLRKQEIIKQLNAAIQHSAIKDIRFI